MLPVNPLAVHSAVMNRAASAPRYATPSHSRGGPRSSPSRNRGWRCRTALPLVEEVALRPSRNLRGSRDGCCATSSTNGSALDLGPGLRPLLVRRALDVGAPVEALLDRRGPVV